MVKKPFPAQAFLKASKKSPASKDQALGWLSSLFMAALVVSRLVASKHFAFLGFQLSCATITYAIALAACTIMSAVYGPAYAYMVVCIGLVVIGIGSWLVAIALCLPVAPFSPISQPAFTHALSFSLEFVLSAMVTYFASYLAGVYAFGMVRCCTALGYGVAVLVNQGVAALVAIALCYMLYPMPWAGCRFVIGQCLFQAALALAFAPLACCAIYAIKRYTCLQTIH